MPKKAVPTKTPSKTLDLDKKIDAIKTLNEEIHANDKEEELEQEPVAKKQPKIIEEVIEEDDPEPVIIRKIIKKKPKQIIEEVVEEESEPEEASGVSDLRSKRTEEKPKPKKKDGRGRPFGSVKKPQEQRQQQQQYSQQQQTYGRNRFDTMLDDSNLELLRQEMKNEMKRRLMSSLFD